MSFSFTFTQQVVTPTGVNSQATTVTASAMAAVNESVATGQTDKLINIAYTYANIVGYFILSDATVTLETNATNAAGGDTITLTANLPKVFYTGFGTNLFTADVTKWYITNASGGTATITARVLYDATP